MIWPFLLYLLFFAWTEKSSARIIGEIVSDTDEPIGLLENDQNNRSLVRCCEEKISFFVPSGWSRTFSFGHAFILPGSQRPSSALRCDGSDQFQQCSSLAKWYPWICSFRSDCHVNRQQSGQEPWTGGDQRDGRETSQRIRCHLRGSIGENGFERGILLQSRRASSSSTIRFDSGQRTNRFSNTEQSCTPQSSVNSTKCVLFVFLVALVSSSAPRLEVEWYEQNLLYFFVSCLFTFLSVQKEYHEWSVFLKIRHGPGRVRRALTCPVW